jgi:hypothetical protein
MKQHDQHNNPAQRTQYLQQKPAVFTNGETLHKVPFEHYRTLIADGFTQLMAAARHNSTDILSDH